MPLKAVTAPGRIPRRRRRARRRERRCRRPNRLRFVLLDTPGGPVPGACTGSAGSTTVAALGPGSRNLDHDPRLQRSSGKQAGARAMPRAGGTQRRIRPMAQAVAAQQGPYGVTVKAGRKYFWCACGLSKRQPFCDGSHSGTDIAPCSGRRRPMAKSGSAAASGRRARRSATAATRGHDGIDLPNRFDPGRDRRPAGRLRQLESVQGLRAAAGLSQGRRRQRPVPPDRVPPGDRAGPVRRRLQRRHRAGRFGLRI